jgi:hypothetical protein
MEVPLHGIVDNINLLIIPDLTNVSHLLFNTKYKFIVKSTSSVNILPHTVSSKT